jgi:hypothetical protein
MLKGAQASAFHAQLSRVANMRRAAVTAANLNGQRSYMALLHKEGMWVEYYTARSIRVSPERMGDWING